MSQKRLGATLLGAALVVWLAFIGLFVHYTATRPRAAEPDQGRVYPINSLGSYSYVTGREFANLFALGAAAFVASGAGYYWLTRK